MFSNNSRPPQNLSSNSVTGFEICFSFRTGSIIFTAFNITNIFLLLPLYIFILYHGLQRWKQKRSSTSSATISHSDCFTYHTAIMELFGVVGNILMFSLIYKEDFIVFLIGAMFHNFNWCGQTCFHILTCMERYLAVVHPITYLSLRNEKGVRIRNISIGCAWMLCFLGLGARFTSNGTLIAKFSLLIFAMTVVSISSISVLCALIGPGPGEQVGGKERTDQSKQRAFYTIVAILGVLVLRFSFGLIRFTLLFSSLPYNCKLLACEMWLNIPSSLVLPFLFLQRAGKLECFKRNQSPDHQ